MDNDDIFLEESLIVVPQTYTKHPGSLFHDNLSLDSSTSLSSTSLSSLLEDFKVRSEAKAIDDTTIKSCDDTTFSVPSRGNLGFMIKRYASWDFPNRPGEMKKNSDDDAELIRLSHKILSFYGISLINKAASSPSRNIYNVLKFLIPEICLFPIDFFKKLQLNQLILSHEDPDKLSSSSQDTSFSLASLDTKLKVIERLYQIISIHILGQNSPKEKVYSLGSFSEVDFEKTFIALMKSSSNVRLKREAEELKKWLSERYPELTEEWFKNRNLEKKKLARVSFAS